MQRSKPPPPPLPLPPPPLPSPPHPPPPVPLTENSKTERGRGGASGPPQEKRKQVEIDSRKKGIPQRKRKHAKLDPTHAELDPTKEGGLEADPERKEDMPRSGGIKGREASERVAASVADRNTVYVSRNAAEDWIPATIVNAIKPSYVRARFEGGREAWLDTRVTKIRYKTEESKANKKKERCGAGCPSMEQKSAGPIVNDNPSPTSSSKGNYQWNGTYFSLTPHEKGQRHGGPTGRSQTRRMTVQVDLHGEARNRILGEAKAKAKAKVKAANRKIDPSAEKPRTWADHRNLAKIGKRMYVHINGEWYPAVLVHYENHWRWQLKIPEHGHAGLRLISIKVTKKTVKFNKPMSLTFQFARLPHFGSILKTKDILVVKAPEGWNPPIWIAECLCELSEKEKDVKVAWYDFYKNGRLWRTKQIDTIDVGSVHGTLGKLPNKRQMMELSDELNLKKI